MPEDRYDRVARQLDEERRRVEDLHSLFNVLEDPVMKRATGEELLNAIDKLRLLQIDAQLAMQELREQIDEGLQRIEVILQGGDPNA